MELSSQEFLKLESIMLKMKDDIINSLLNLLMPKEPTISYISSITGKSRQTITSYLYSNFESDVDFAIKNGRITLQKSTALALIKYYGEKNAKK